MTNQPTTTTQKGVIKTIVGKDQRVRSAVVQTAKGIYERSVVKLAVLDVGSSKVGKPNNVVIPGGNVIDATDSSKIERTHGDKDEHEMRMNRPEWSEWFRRKAELVEINITKKLKLIFNFMN